MNKIKNILTAICIFSLTTTPVLAKEKVKKPKVIHVCKKDDSSVNILACNIYMESRSEPLKGKMAVAFVTINRLQKEKFPSTIGTVVFQRKQFSWVGTHSKVTDAEAWKESKKVAKFVYNLKDSPSLYDFADPTKGSVYYHRKDVKPKWRHAMIRQTIIGPHIFYIEKDV